MAQDRSSALSNFYNIARAVTKDDEAARIFAAVAAREGGLTGNVGDQGRSLGPLQFFTQGQLPNFARFLGVTPVQAGQVARDPSRWRDVVEFAWQGYFGNAIRQGRARGLSGPALASFVSKYGQRSVNPEESGRQYAALFQRTPAERTLRAALTDIPRQPSGQLAPPPPIMQPYAVVSPPPSLSQIIADTPQGTGRDAEVDRAINWTRLATFIPQAIRAAMPETVDLGEGLSAKKDLLFKAVDPAAATVAAPEPFWKTWLRGFSERQQQTPKPAVPSGPRASSGITTEGQAALMAMLPEAELTSGTRTVERNRKIGGDPQSRHLTGNAIDIVPRKGHNWQTLLGKLRPLEAKGYIRIIYGTPGHTDHIHVTVLKPLPSAQSPVLPPPQPRS